MFRGGGEGGGRRGGVLSPVSFRLHYHIWKRSAKTLAIEKDDIIETYPGKY